MPDSYRGPFPRRHSGVSQAGSGAPDEVGRQMATLKAQQDRLFSELARGQQHFRILARSVWRIQEEERRRLARELHDGIGQQITAVIHRLQRLTQSEGIPPALASELARTTELCAHALEDTRALSRMLRPQILDDLGLVAALRWLARSVAETGGFTVDVVCDDTIPDDIGELSTLIFRVAQEALTNVVKHAKADNVLIRLQRQGETLRFIAADDGLGFEQDAAMLKGSRSLSSGLSSIKERAALFSGRLSLVTAPGHGTQLRLVVPLPGHEDDRDPLARNLSRDGSR